ncbi:integral membrane sensor signal transduction histidine kinase [Flammeovirgaceae bacterium 311]|nr:integral membrane sensor signal transduction histidine kinase [Flammeovirgaceae bacterium 311]
MAIFSKNSSFSMLQALCMGLLLLLCCQPAAASEETPVYLGHIRYLPDSLNEQTLERVQQLAEQGWQTSYNPAAGGSLWVSFTIKNRADAPTAVLLSVGDIALMELYMQREEGLELQRSGLFMSIAQRSYAHHRPLFSISLAAGEEVQALLKLDTQNRQHLPGQFKPLLKTAAAQKVDDDRRLLLQGLFFGIILVMAFYNLLLYIGVRDISYLWYVLSILGIGVYFFFYYGFSLQTIWRHQPLWNAYSFALIVPLTNMMRIMFTKTYLHTRDLLPWLDRFLNFLFVLCFVPIIIGGMAWWWGFAWYELTIDVTGVLGTVVLVCMLIAGVYAYLQGYTPALFFIVANLLFVLGANMFIIKEMRLIEDSLFSRYVVQLGVIAQVVLFSLGLAYRLKKARQQEAEHRLTLERIEREKEVERKQEAEEQKARLEEKVRERTAALHEKTLELQATIHKLQESQEGLRQLNKIKDKLFSVISHDLRGPVATLDSFISLITNHAARISAAEMEKLSDKTRESVHSLSFLLDNLLNWSRTQMGTLPYNPQPVVLTDTILRNVELYQLMAENKKVSLVMDVPKASLALADRGMLDFIIRNLLSNAIKFTPRFGTIKLIVQEQKGSIWVRVTDTGIGIAPEKLPFVLDTESNYSTPGTAREKGTGLGLMLCQEFLAFHGSQLQVHSEVSIGSEFFFSLPGAVAEVQQKHATAGPAW